MKIFSHKVIEVAKLHQSHGGKTKLFKVKGLFLRREETKKKKKKKKKKMQKGSI